MNLMKNLRKGKPIYDLFRVQIDEMVDAGVLRKVQDDYPKRYLPLVTICNPENESTKIRICVNGKCKFNGISLNDTLLKGKLELVDVFQALTQFRCGEYTILGDIRKMYWQIKMTEADQRYHGVIADGETFVFTRLCFGDKPSSRIADDCMLMVARLGNEDYPFGSKVIEDKKYVDDILDASSQMSEIKLKKDETTELLGKYGFLIKEWFSNHPDIGTVKNDCPVLCLQWNAEKDELSPGLAEANEIRRMSKRSVLSTLAEIRDPCCGLVISVRLIFQSIVRMKKDWDETIFAEDLIRSWHN